MSSCTKAWVVSQGSDSVCLFAVFRFHRPLSLRCFPPLPLSPLLTLSPRSTTPLQLRGTTPPGRYPLSPSPLTPVPPFHAEEGHSMPLMWPWPHVPAACQADLEAAGCSSTLCDWWKGCPLLSPSMPHPWLGGQHSISWAHLCGAQALHLKCSHRSCLVHHDSLGNKTCVTFLYRQPSSDLTVSSLSPCSVPLTDKLLCIYLPEYALILHINFHHNLTIAIIWVTQQEISPGQYGYSLVIIMCTESTQWHRIHTRL